jgi:hypothetical protein
MLSGGNKQDDIFFMSLEEAKDFIAGKYEFLAERYERKQQPKKMKPSQG